MNNLTFQYPPYYIALPLVRYTVPFLKLSDRFQRAENNSTSKRSYQDQTITLGHTLEQPATAQRNM